jgi:hypothetical protein
MSSLAILLISINPRDQQVLGLTPYAGLVTRLRGPTADVAAFREPGSAPPTDFQPAGFAVSGTVIDTLNVGWRHRDRHRKRIPDWCYQAPSRTELVGCDVNLFAQPTFVAESRRLTNRSVPSIIR